MLFARCVPLAVVMMLIAPVAHAEAISSVPLNNPPKSMFKEKGDEVIITIEAQKGINGAKPTVLKLNKGVISNAISIGDHYSTDTASSSASSGTLTVVVGERVRTNPDVAAIIMHTNIVQNPRTVESRHDLALVAARALMNDERATNISYDSKSVVVEYRETVHVFGIVPIPTWSKVEVGSDGRVSVRSPWWSNFFKKEILPKEMKAQIALALTEKSSNLSNLDVYAREAVMIDTVADVIKQRNTTSDN